MKKHPLIIIEGQDRCGKSTLIEQLAEIFKPNFITFHSGSPPKFDSADAALQWEINNYSLLYTKYKEMTDDYTILLDRFHLGVPVYGKKYRGYNTDLHCSDIDRNFTDLDNTFLIVVTDSAESIMKREDGISFEKTAEEYENTRLAFVEEYKHSCVKNKLLLNITDIGGFDYILTNVIEFYGRISYYASSKRY
jgi:thymidylate kinase